MVLTGGMAMADGRTVDGCSELLNDQKFSHTRIGTGCWREVIWIYHFDDNSPTRVKLAGSTDETILAQVTNRPRHSSPLSPTEPR
jgi:hypothetical protein